MMRAYNVWLNLYATDIDVISVEMNHHIFEVEIGQVVALNVPHRGFSNKKFVVVGRTIDLDSLSGTLLLFDRDFTMASIADFVVWEHSRGDPEYDGGGIQPIANFSAMALHQTLPVAITAKKVQFRAYLTNPSYQVEVRVFKNATGSRIDDLTSANLVLIGSRIFAPGEFNSDSDSFEEVALDAPVDLAINDIVQVHMVTTPKTPYDEFKMRVWYDPDPADYPDRVRYTKSSAADPWVDTAWSNSSFQYQWGTPLRFLSHL
jgi:hypothetical protein